MKVEVDGQVFDTDSVMVILDNGRSLEIGPDYIAAYECEASEGSVTEISSLFD